MSLSRLTKTLLAAVALLASSGVLAQEAAIRKTLAERLPTLPKIDEVTSTPIPGIYEVRFGTDIVYSDATGEHIFINGALIATKTRTDLTEARLEKLLAIDFDKLPMKDAFVMRQGSGAGKMAVFVDPNCGFCKRFERDLTSIKDVSIYVFLIPILGQDSVAKSRDVWCAKEPARVWRDWMLEAVVPPKAAGKCDTAAIDRNLAFARSYRINGTPAVVFEDGTRKPGAIPSAEVERLLVAASARR